MVDCCCSFNWSTLPFFLINVVKCFQVLFKEIMNIHWAMTIIQSMVQFEAKKSLVPFIAYCIAYKSLKLIKFAWLCWPHDGLQCVPWDHYSTMHQTNDINYAINDVIMVELNGQKWRLFLYTIHSRYILIYTFTRHIVGLWHVILGCLQPVGPTIPGTSTSVWYVGCALYHRNKYPILLLVCVLYKSKDHRYKYPILLLVCVWYKSKDTLKQVLNTTGPWVNYLLLYIIYLVYKLSEFWYNTALL